MTFATDERTKQAVEQFRGFDVDTQLALLWFGYLDIKDKLIPANQTSAQDTAAALYDQIQAKSKEEQLQAQRDLASRADTDISRAYTALSSSAKLDVWLRLARGMENDIIIPMPSDYKLPENTKGFVDTIKSLEFEQRVDFTRSVVMEMGAK
ncbi:orange carotenoid protein N-terminal domain-containing protein [Chlorogloeopsis sp. ULAP01]|uniref:orange carotenoid protein N-terminal domain-containing protein n=1 Tax=Chlorogloeopsis sp. ULAP01 TaxID=3056483 RepID=UPI0025AA3C50|nr:orange carotenoid protein N-terminal domain-containing protein [Chlorogloeopsis sp. ULAP01]MDM9385136.1 orange carotenoid protein N-terminal domain-containing protein [Chlorogloeopsis sp. ULAP01]